MALDRKRFGYGKAAVVRDIRPLYVRLGDALQLPLYSTTTLLIGAMSLFFVPMLYLFSDIIFILYCLFFWWLYTRDRALSWKTPPWRPLRRHK